MPDTDLVVEFSVSRIEKAFALTLQNSRHSKQFEFHSMCKGVVGKWYGITPPAMGQATGQLVSDFDAQSALRGVGAIKRDLLGGKKRAGLFAPLPDDLIDQALESGVYQTDNVRLFTKSDGTVYGTDKTLFEPDAGYDEIRAIHKANFKDGRMSSAGAYTQDIGRWKFINRYVIRQSSFDSYMDEMIKKVGWLASTLNGAARLTGARIPEYARGKHAPSDEALELGEDRQHFYFGNLISWADHAADGDLQRRFDAAVEYEASALFRRLPYLVEDAAAKAGFQIT